MIRSRNSDSEFGPMDREQLSQKFRTFAEVEALPSSPLYERLSRGIAEDNGLLELAAFSGSGQPPPNLLFAAVQYLLLKQLSDEPLRRCYPGLSDSPEKLDPFPLFQSFCLRNREAIQHLLETRLVQTNEVRRSSAIAPGVAMIYREAGNDLPLCWIEIGASAGLNLLWDRYYYRYGESLEWGNPAAMVHIPCGLRGETLPPLPPYPVAIAFRSGIDRNPLDLTDPDTALWLRALIWPEQADRIQLLTAAIAEAQRNPPSLVAGDALTLLPATIAQAPRDALLCIFHSYTIYQFTQEMRRELDDLLRDASHTRPIYRLGLEGARDAPFPLLKLLTYGNGEREDRVLAQHEAHGLWIHWQE